MCLVHSLDASGNIIYAIVFCHGMCLWVTFSAFFVVLYVKVLFKMTSSSYNSHFLHVDRIEANGSGDL
jgi:hypothetical protein